MIRVTEVFESIQGEGLYAGRPALFVRLPGCNLDCPFCDTRNQGPVKEYTEEHLSSLIEESKAQIVVITGGEPTSKENMPHLRTIAKISKDTICEGRKIVVVETNGESWVRDVKASEGVTPKDVISRDVDHIVLSPKFPYGSVTIARESFVLFTRFDYIHLKILFEGKDKFNQHIRPFFYSHIIGKFTAMAALYKPIYIQPVSPEPFSGYDRDTIFDILSFSDIFPYIQVSLQMHKVMGVK